MKNETSLSARMIVNKIEMIEICNEDIHREIELKFSHTNIEISEKKTRSNSRVRNAVRIISHSSSKIKFIQLEIDERKRKRDDCTE